MSESEGASDFGDKKICSWSCPGEQIVRCYLPGLPAASCRAANSNQRGTLKPEATIRSTAGPVNPRSRRRFRQSGQTVADAKAQPNCTSRPPNIRGVTGSVKETSLTRAGPTGVLGSGFSARMADSAWTWWCRIIGHFRNPGLEPGTRQSEPNLEPGTWHPEPHATQVRAGVKAVPVRRAGGSAASRCPVSASWRAMYAD
jgi:hypothetical protein